MDIPEQQLFNDNDALVSTTRVIIGGTTYPLVNVSSVSLRASSVAFKYVLVVFFAIGAFSSLVSKSWGGAVFCIVIALMIWFLVQVKYRLILGTSGGEKTALKSKDRDYMTRLKDAIDTAVVSRG